MNRSLEQPPQIAWDLGHNLNTMRPLAGECQAMRSRGFGDTAISEEFGLPLSVVRILGQINDDAPAIATRQRRPRKRDGKRRVAAHA
jgi:hypothetical protein